MIRYSKQGPSAREINLKLNLAIDIKVIYMHAIDIGVKNSVSNMGLSEALQGRSPLSYGLQKPLASPWASTRKPSEAHAAEASAQEASLDGPGRSPRYRSFGPKSKPRWAWSKLTLPKLRLEEQASTGLAKAHLGRDRVARKPSVGHYGTMVRTFGAPSLEVSGAERPVLEVPRTPFDKTAGFGNRLRRHTSSQ
ncbi:hypothetical protein GUJ93_ZPchr0010g7591 [Zizania palustris]|uniref:Uncharacterized protein n=1 Tax=Zizania palustris TaxID=103762 RepID=A0A8J5THQ1_ZIZPA|nr:hypothetical protein GUJ93_ZPchr0010g7591 [Zizania palustris]